MRFQFLVENKTDHPDIMAEHGLSIYIEADHQRVLFDAGATDLLLLNAERMGVDLTAVDFAVVSHGHYDHTGGIPGFCTLNDTAPVYLHRDAFRKSYGLEGGRREKETCGLRWTQQEKEKLKDRLVLTDGPRYITENICITGTIPYADNFRPAERFYYQDAVGNWIEDDLSHEQCLVIRQPEGLYLFSGCSHRGAVSALEAGKAMFPGERIAAFIAGMHLYHASAEERHQVVAQVVAEAPDRVVPVHCTGIQAICDLKTELGDGCIVATAGDCFDGC